MSHLNIYIYIHTYTYIYIYIYIYIYRIYKYIYICNHYAISTYNHMSVRAIWDKLPDCIFENVQNLY